MRHWWFWWRETEIRDGNEWEYRQISQTHGSYRCYFVNGRLSSLSLNDFFNLKLKCNVCLFRNEWQHVYVLKVCFIFCVSWDVTVCAADVSKRVHCRGFTKTFLQKPPPTEAEGIVFRQTTFAEGCAGPIGPFSSCISTSSPNTELKIVPSTKPGLKLELRPRRPPGLNKD